jgi:hypothetical protein
VFVAAIATAIAEGGSAEDCYRAALEEAKRSHVGPPVLDVLRDAAEKPPEDYDMKQGWVLIALQNAFYELMHAGSLEEGVVQTVMQGGDTDTNAAIVGALLGAVYGREAVPAQWIRSVLSCRPLPESGTSHPRPAEFWPVDAMRLAERARSDWGAAFGWWALTWASVGGMLGRVKSLIVGLVVRPGDGGFIFSSSKSRGIREPFWLRGISTSGEMW